MKAVRRVTDYIFEAILRSLPSPGCCVCYDGIDLEAFKKKDDLA